MRNINPFENKIVGLIRQKMARAIARAFVSINLFTRLQAQGKGSCTE